MMSQHVQYTRVASEKAHEKPVRVNRPGRIDTSGRTLSSNSHEGTRVQPQLISKQELEAMNEQLLTAGGSIENIRHKLFQTHFVAASAQSDLEQERQVRKKCSDAYTELHIRHGANVAEMHNMTTKCVSLRKEFEESQKTLSDYVSYFGEYKRRAAEDEDKIRHLERRGVETADQIRVLTDRDNSAKKRIDELERERAKLIEEHQTAISVRMARESLAAQRIDELQDGIDALEREHQAAMTSTIERMQFAEQKVRGFDKMPGLSELQETALICPSPSPVQSLRSSKRPRSETGGRTSKHRKCKDATMMQEEGTIVVET